MKNGCLIIGIQSLIDEIISKRVEIRNVLVCRLTIFRKEVAGVEDVNAHA